MKHITYFTFNMNLGSDGITRVVDQIQKRSHLNNITTNYISSNIDIQSDYDVKMVPSVPIPFAPYPEWRLGWASVSQISKLLPKKPDLIHIHTPCSLGYSAMKYAKFHKIPIVATYHTNLPVYFKYYCKYLQLEKLGWQYMRKLFNSCDVIIVPSQETFKKLEENGLKNLVCIPHGVNIEQFSPQYRNKNWRTSMSSPDKTIVTYVGRLAEEKNLSIFPEIWKNIVNKEQIQLVFVGDGPIRSKLQRLLPHAKFTGHLHAEELSIAYASSDIFVLPSTTETFGNVTVEAMASGLAVVAANAGGTIDIIQNGITGLLAEPDNPQDIARCINQFTIDSKYRDKICKEALISSRKFSWATSAEKTFSLYDHVISRAKAHKEHVVSTYPFI